jgi:hypothetical protein
MVEQTKKTAAKKVATVKSKATKAESAPVAKRVASKKAEAVASESGKSKSSAVKKASSPMAKTKAPSKQLATSKTKSPSAENKVAVQPTPEERYRMVETAAYFIAEQHGFQGRSDEHWAAAERVIAAKLNQ